MITTSHVHNLKPENSARWRADLELAKTGHLSEWKVESNSSGTGALVVPPTGFDHLKAWPLYMLDEISKLADVPIAGTGMVRINDNTLLDNRWGGGAGWNRSLKTVAYIGNNLYPARFTPDRSGDRLTVYYRDGGMSEPLEFTISPGFTITNSMTPAWQKITIEGDFPAGTATRIKKSAGAQLMLSGACVWSSAGGLMLHNVGQGGSAAHGTGVLNDRWTDETGREALGKVYADVTVGEDPLALLILVLGGNDKRLHVDDQLVLDAIRRRRDLHPDSDCILVAETQLADSLVPRPVWETFLAGLHDLKDELDVPLIDQDAALGPFKTIAANGWNADSAGHLKAPILEQLGRSTAAALLAT